MLAEDLQGEKDISICDGLFSTFVTALDREVNAERYLHPSPLANPESMTTPGNKFAQRMEQYIEQHVGENFGSGACGA